MPLIDLRGLNKYYQIRVRCTNCNQVQDLKVPKGETKERFLKDGKCDNCGCVDVLILRENDNREKKKVKNR